MREGTRAFLRSVHPNSKRVNNDINFPKSRLSPRFRSSFCESGATRLQVSSIKSGEFPEAFKGMAELGLMGVAVPEEWGGRHGQRFLRACNRRTRLAVHLGVITSVNNSLVNDPLLRFGNDAQKEEWLKPIAQGSKIGCFALSEPGTGSDAAAQSTVAEKKGNEWVIRGAKNWITNGAQADLCIVFAMGDKSKGVKGINAYLVPTNTPGFVVAKNEEKLGIKASSTSQISLDEVVLPEGALLGNVVTASRLRCLPRRWTNRNRRTGPWYRTPGFRDGARPTRSSARPSVVPLPTSKRFNLCSPIWRLKSKHHVFSL